MNHFPKKIFKISFILLIYVIFTSSCTTKEQKDEFIGKYHLIEDSQKTEKTVLTINEDRTFETNCYRFSSQEGKWDVSELPTAVGIVITFYDENGGFSGQLHWKEEQIGQILESQETEEQYVRRYERIKEIDE